MNHQTLLNKETVPSGGFRFLQADTGVWITAPSWTELIQRVKAHRKANNIPISPELEQQIETQLCETLPPGQCTYVVPSHSRRARRIARPKWEKYVEATATMLKTAKEGLATLPEANAHAATCARCQFNQSPDGCTSCNMQELVDLVAKYALKKTEHDSKLKGCLLCGCALRAKVHIRAEVARAIAVNYLDILPDWCWIKKPSEP